MRKLIWVLIAASALWAVYWFIGARAVEQGFAGWIEELRANGVAVEVGAIETRGLPNRFDTTLSDIALDFPQEGVSWRAPFAQVLALSYKPNHVIAVLPDRQEITLRGLPLVLEAERLRGSVVVLPELALGLDRTAFVGETLVLNTPRGTRLEIDEMRLASRRTAATDRPRHDIGFDLENARLVPGPDLTLPATLPPLIERAHLEAIVTLDAPLDRHTLAKAPPRPTAIEFGAARLNWGDMELSAEGALTIGRDGFPEGQIDLTAVQWRDMLALAVDLGWVDPNLSGTIETGMGLLSGLSGDGALRLPLVFAGGRMSIGPIPLGAAPRLFAPDAPGQALR